MNQNEKRNKSIICFFKFLYFILFISSNKNVFFVVLVLVNENNPGENQIRYKI